MSESQSSAPKAFGFGNFDVDRYRQAAFLIDKQRLSSSISLQSVQKYLKEFWDASTGNIFPPTMSSAISLFQSRIQLDKLEAIPAEWPQCFSPEPMNPSAFEGILSQLLLKRDFELGLLGHSAPDVLSFLAIDSTFLWYLKSLLASPGLYPHQPSSCLPHVIRSLMDCNPIFLEIMLQLLPSSQDIPHDGEPPRITEGARLCHILEYSFGFSREDLKPLYARLVTIPLSSISVSHHSGEWRAVTESPPRRYSVKGEALGVITKYCVDSEEGEGIPCLHRQLGPDRSVLTRDHWSCCGSNARLDMMCIHSKSSPSRNRCSGLKCSVAHPLTVRVCLPSELPVMHTGLVCAQCGLDCHASSCVSTFCSVCNHSICLACSESINNDGGPNPQTEGKKKAEADSSSSGSKGGAAAGGGAGAKSSSGGESSSKLAPSSKMDTMIPDIAAFVEDCHSGASWVLTKMFCDAIDKKQMQQHGVHTIHLLLTSLNLQLYDADECSSFDIGCCRSLAGAITAVLARQHLSSYPDRDIPLDLRSKRDSSTSLQAEAVAVEVPYLQSLYELIKPTKRFNEFADALVQKIHVDHPTPAELISLTADRNRLLIALEVAYFELKHPKVSKSKCGFLKQLLEMGCFPRKFAVKAVLKSSTVEAAVNVFFSESRTASDEDESEDAVLSNAGSVSEALKSFVEKSPSPSKDSSDKTSGGKLQLISEIEANFDFSELLAAISNACSSLEFFRDLKELTYPIMKALCDQVEVVAGQEKRVPSSSSHQTSERDRRLFFQSLIDSLSFSRFVESLRCTAGHPLALQIGQERTRCIQCRLPLPASVQHLSCENTHRGSKTSKQCDFAMCVSCGEENVSAQFAIYSHLDISTSIHALESLISHSKLPENMKNAFSSIAGSADFAVKPTVPFGWTVPEIPKAHAPSPGDICGPDCSLDHNDASSVCIRCDRRPSSHKGHQCSDNQRGYFIHSQSASEGQSPSIHGPLGGSQEIDMHYSSARPISLVHSDAGFFAGRKWTCTLVNTGERGQNTWIGLCDAAVVAQYVGSSDFKGLGTRSKGFSIGFHPELGVRIDDKTTSRSFTCKEGDGISIEYDEPGRKLDVIIAKQVVYTHAGLPPNLMFAISSGDKKSKYIALKCRQVDVPSSLDAGRSSILESISKAILDSAIWNSENIFALLSLLSTFRTKPHHVLSSKFLGSTQATLLRIISELIESDALNVITSRSGASDIIFTELNHIVDFDRKPLLLSCVTQMKRVSIALLQGHNTLSKDSLGFLSKLHAFCSRGFAQTSAAAFDFLIRCTTDLESSESIVQYLRIPRWVIEAIDPSRSFLSVYSMFGACFPAMLHSGWVDVEKKDGKSVRLSCEAAQVMLNREAAKDPIISASLTIAPVLQIGRVSASIDRELSMNGLLTDFHFDSDIVQTPLHTAALPSSIHIGSGCIDAVAWFKRRLCAQDRLDEIEALAACCEETESPPAIVQSVLTDLVRRAFVIREHGYILLASKRGNGADMPSKSSDQPKKVLLKENSADDVLLSMPSPPLFTKHPVFGVLPQCDSFKISKAVFFTIEDTFDDGYPWTCSISSASSVTIKDFEVDLSDTLDSLSKLGRSIDILQTARMFEECNGSVTAFVFKQEGNGAPSSASVIIKSIGFCPSCLDDDVELVSSPCGHVSCVNCYRHLLETAISDSGSPLLAKGYDNLISITSIKCMDNGCHEHLPLTFLQQVVPDLADVTRRILVRTLLRVLNNSACPISSCLCGQSMLIGTSQDCEAVCGQCGRCATIGDFKRKEIPAIWIPHPTISSEENLDWNSLNDPGNASSRRDLMRFKACPHCGTTTTRCGCEPSKIMCDNLERCPNEKCDHIDCTVCKKRWCWVCGSPSCPTRCSKPAIERTHRKEKFILSQKAIAGLSKSIR